MEEDRILSRYAGMGGEESVKKGRRGVDLGGDNGKELA